MNPQYRWLPAFAGTLAAGWVIGHGMGGGDPDSAADGTTASSFAPTGTKAVPLAPAATGSGSKDFPKATADEEAHIEASILRALRKTNLLRRDHDLYAAIAKLSPGEISAAITRAQSLSETERFTLMPMLASRWAETDPREAMAFALGQSEQVTKAVVSIWAASDPQAALAWGKTLPPGEARRRVLTGLAEHLARRDPAAALEIVGLLPPGHVTDYAEQRVFTEWAAQDPTAAASRALSLPAGEKRDGIINVIVNRWAETDPHAAIAWTGQLPKTNNRSVALNNAYITWATIDPPGARAAALALPPGQERDTLLRWIFWGSGARDLPAAFKFLDQMTPMTRSITVMELVNGMNAWQWGSVAPEAILPHLMALPPDGMRDHAMSQMFAKWADEDVSVALAWSAQLPDEATRARLQQAGVYQWAQRDPRAAADYWMKTGPRAGLDSSELLAGVVAQWARLDAPEVLAWVRQIGEEKLRGAMLLGIVGGLAGADPPQSAGLIAQLPARHQARAAGLVAKGFMENDPGTAAAWVAGLPEGEVRSAAARTVAEIWTKLDLAATEGWLNNLPAGRSRDAAVSAASAVTGNNRFRPGITWALTIADPETRESTIEGIVAKWLRWDRKSTVNWINQTPALSAELKQRLLPKE